MTDPTHVAADPGRTRARLLALAAVGHELDEDELLDQAALITGGDRHSARLARAMFDLRSAVADQAEAVRRIAVALARLGAS